MDASQAHEHQTDRATKSRTPLRLFSLCHRYLNLSHHHPVRAPPPLPATTSTIPCTCLLPYLATELKSQSHHLQLLLSSYSLITYRLHLNSSATSTTISSASLHHYAHINRLSSTLTTITLSAWQHNSTPFSSKWVMRSSSPLSPPKSTQLTGKSNTGSNGCWKIKCYNS